MNHCKSTSETPPHTRHFATWCTAKVRSNWTFHDAVSVLFCRTNRWINWVLMRVRGAVTETIADVSSWQRANARNIGHCLFYGAYYPHQHSVDTPVCFPPCWRRYQVLLRAGITLFCRASDSDGPHTKADAEHLSGFPCFVRESKGWFILETLSGYPLSF